MSPASSNVSLSGVLFTTRVLLKARNDFHWQPKVFIGHSGYLAL